MGKTGKLNCTSHVIDWFISVNILIVIEKLLKYVRVSSFIFLELGTTFVTY